MTVSPQTESPPAVQAEPVRTLRPPSQADYSALLPAVVGWTAALLVVYGYGVLMLSLLLGWS